MKRLILSGIYLKCDPNLSLVYLIFIYMPEAENVSTDNIQDEMDPHVARHSLNLVT